MIIYGDVTDLGRERFSKKLVEQKQSEQSKQSEFSAFPYIKLKLGK